MSKEPDPLAGNARDDWNDWRDDQGVYPTALNPPAKYYVDGGHLVYPKAQRPWVGLTDDEISARATNFYNPEMYKRAVLWAQEKLKERNQ